MTPQHKFTLLLFEHGVAVDGPIPLSAFRVLDAFDEYGVVDVAATHTLRNLTGRPISIALTSPADQKAWRQKLQAEVDVRFAYDPIGRHLAGLDAGRSATTIAYALTGRTMMDIGPDGHVPKDWSDFGRCMRLVEAMGWRDLLDEVAVRYPDWAPIVVRWDDLCQLYAAAERPRFEEALS